ncbi:hypothetical protein LZ198_14815 [Myxococcus sp. K15C18031901]|uniref:hypothetical protein n=1 Tax=Myxococcus dinghuensis TaxID=2906761 RepID=UPI0020A78EF8|nr:hypothetical protein [Myxococcus dinghuensis]MCP3100145.1 hypothetical protein [Myxococcus dinghuensis]
MTLRLLVPLLSVCLLGGCIVHHHDRHDSRPSKSKKSKNSSRDCDPSEYFVDGACRHKGKGKGARKHDG